MLEYICEDRSEFSDIYFNDINSKNLKIPVQNNSECDRKFKRGTILGKLTLLQNENDTRIFTQGNIKFVKTSETIVKGKCYHVLELSNRNKEKLNHIIDSYRLKISNVPLAKPINLSIEHCIDLKDDIPTQENSTSRHDPRKFLIHLKN